MGYNLSRQKVIKYKPLLEQLAKEKKTISFGPVEDPKDLAYGLREGAKAALKYEEFKDLRGVYGNYSFSPKERMVVAKYKGIEDIEAVVVKEEEKEEKVEKKVKTKEEVKLDKWLDKLTIDTANSLLDIFGSILSNSNYGELTFPNAVLSPEEKLRLYAWTKEGKNNEWKFIDHEEKGVTLSRKEVPHEILWQPGEE